MTYHVDEQKYRGIRRAVAPAAIVTTFLLASTFNMAFSQIAAPLGTAQNFAVLGGSTVTNTGPTVLHGDLGVSPGSAITGFPPGNLIGGSTYPGDAVAMQAQADTATAYNNLAGQACTVTYGVPTDIGGLTLASGVYCFASSVQLTGTVTLNGGGDPDAVWIFKTGSTLITAANSSVLLTDGAQQCKVFWKVGSSATLGAGTDFVGSILALASITFDSNATLSGRALAQTGAVTLDSNTVSFKGCAHNCYAVTSKVTNTITVAPPVRGSGGAVVAGSVLGASLSPDAKSIWVTGYNGSATPGFVSLIDVASHSVTNTVKVGLGPADIAFSTLGGTAWVTNQYGSSLSQIDVPSLRVNATTAVGGGSSQYPYGIVHTGGNILVTTAGKSNSASMFDTANPPRFRNALAFQGQGGRPAALSADSAYYANDMLVPAFVGTGANGAGYPSLSIVRPSTGSVVASVSLPSSGAMPEAVVTSPDGHYAYVSLFDATGGKGGVWVVNLATLKTKTIIVTGDPANFGEAMSGDGQYLLVSGFSRNQVALIYTASDEVDNIIQGGEQPNGIALNSDSSEAYIANQTDGTVSVISFTPHL